MSIEFRNEVDSLLQPLNSTDRSRNTTHGPGPVEDQSDIDWLIGHFTVTVTLGYPVAQSMSP